MRERSGTAKRRRAVLLLRSYALWLIVASVEYCCFSRLNLNRGVHAKSKTLNPGSRPRGKLAFVGQDMRVPSTQSRISNFCFAQRSACAVAKTQLQRRFVLRNTWTPAQLHTPCHPLAQQSRPHKPGRAGRRQCRASADAATADSLITAE